MPQSARPTFQGGPSLAMKVPPHLFDQTVAFYRDTLGLTPLRTAPDSCGFQWGAMELWLDRVATVSQAEIWLQIQTPNTADAGQNLAAEGVVRRDEIEPLPDGFEGFWIGNPAGIIHLVSRSQE
ncbi:MAG: hypothetical protein GKR89_24455 [Candidatus Latescibacteria bacterium]|nr:hypothetical protein [Candidatus Latescibacterota bacterium]